MNRLIALSFAISTVLPAVPASSALSGPDLEIQALSESAPGVTTQRPAGPDAASMPPSTLPDWPTSVYPYYQTLKSFTFDVGGMPHAEGWTMHDLTVQDGIFWHADDFAGLPAPYGPLAGSRSMWCGVRSNVIFDPAYKYAPGYGNRWMQILTSLEFSSTPTTQVTIQYKLSHDLYPNDRVDLEFKSASGVWTQLATYTDLDMSGATRSHDVPAAAVGGTIQFRFIVSTGQTRSDEDTDQSDGAVILDDIFIIGSNLFSADTFENAPVGDTASAYWTGSVPAPFGSHAGVVSGAQVEQAGTPNTSYLWSFFNGSSVNYGCGGYPLQPAVPYTSTPGSTRIGDYLVNEIRSPFINLSVDIDNQPVNPDFSAFGAEFDVYTDLDYPVNTIMYTFRWRFLINGDVQPWINKGIAYFSPTPQWVRVGPGTFNGTIPAGATHVQIGLIAFDFAYGTGATALCHSQSPLFDNVTIHRLYPPLGVANTNDSGAGSLRQAILSANANANMNTILFAIPGDGPHVIQPATPLPVITAPVWIDGFTQPGASPNPYPFPASTAVMKVEIDGSLLAGSGNGLHFGSGGYGVARGLVIGGFPEAGVRSEASSLNVNGCYIGTDIWGTTARPNNIGIMVSNSATEIGGVFAQERVVIAANATDGLVIEDDPGFPSYTTIVFGTYLGVAANGSPMGNGQHGVHVLSGVGAQIGQPAYAPCVTGYTDRNWIAYNLGDGVRVENTAMNVMISNNRVHNNGNMGIDLGGDGYTPPDALDLDTGANGLQNRPELTAATGTTISGYLNTAPNTLYRVEFFINGNCISGGQEYIGYQEMTTDGNGQVPIWFTCSAIPPASWITATVTTWSGGTNTSEFSDCVMSNNTVPGSPLVNLYDTSNILRASLVYDNIVSAGNTFLAPTSPPAPVPGGFDVGLTPSYWDITTTATYDGAVHVSLHYDPNAVPGPENMLRLLHHDGIAWVDITDDVDIANDRIGGTTNGLSPFVLAVPTGATGVGDGEAPDAFALHANIPNPFNPATTITYDVPAGGAQVEIAIFDVAGRRVRTLVDEHRGAGTHTARWSGEDEHGARVSSGVYFYRMRAGTFVETRKMVLLK